MSVTSIAGLVWMFWKGASVRSRGDRGGLLNEYVTRLCEGTSRRPGREQCPCRKNLEEGDNCQWTSVIE